jgi:alpha-L-fucosidase
MWPTRTRNPRKRGWQVARDVVGELAEGARALGLKVGVYYSAGLDGTFGSTLTGGPVDPSEAIPRTRSYAAYVDAHWRELVSRYSPSILWNDVGSPASQDLLSLFSDFYDAVPDGVVNDRFGQPEAKDSRGDRFIWSALRRLFPPRAARLPASDGMTLPARHSDFRTIESGGEYPDGEGPWECVRSLDDAEMDGGALTGSALVRQLCDVTARGGRLLLRLVPKADGTLGPFQTRSLSTLGGWLKLNGEAIFGTRPWGEREGATEDGVEVRFTTKGMTAYAILMGTPPGRTIVLPSLRLQPYAGLRVLGSIGYAAWFQVGRDLHIRLTEPLRESPAHVVSMTPQPRA